MIDKTEDYNKIKGRIQFAEKYYEKHKPRLDRYLKIYEDADLDVADGEWWDSDVMVVNEVLPTIQYIKGANYFGRPYFIVKDDDEKDLGAQAMVLEAKINKKYDELKIDDEIDLMLDDWLIYGRGFMEYGWSYEVNYIPEEKNSDNDKKKKKNKEVVTKDEMKINRLSVHKFWYDPTATNLKKARYAVKRVYMTREEAEERWSVLKDVETNTKIDYGNYLDGDNYDGLLTEGDSDIFAIYEYYEKASKKYPKGRYLGYVEGYDDFLFEYDLPCALEEIPVLEIRDYNVPDKQFPLSEIKLIEPQQAELNDIRTAMKIHRKRAKRKYVIDKSTGWDQKAKDALRSDDDLAVIEVEKNGQLAITPVQDNPLSPDIYRLEGIIKQDMQRSVGISDYERSGISQRQITLGEAQLSVAGGQVRGVAKRRAIKAFLKDLGEKMLYLLLRYGEGEDIVELDVNQPEDDIILTNLKERYGDKFSEKFNRQKDRVVAKFNYDDIKDGKFRILLDVTNMLPPQPIPHERDQQIMASMQQQQAGVQNQKQNPTENLINKITKPLNKV